MAIRINDPEVQQLVAIAGIIEQDYRNAATEWTHSPFGWIKALPSRSAGAVFEALVAGWCAAKGLDVTRSPDSDADRVISGLRTEIKGSTLWRVTVQSCGDLLIIRPLVEGQPSTELP